MNIWDCIRENAEIIVASSSIIIAVIALGVSVWQGIVTRIHNRKMVLPFVAFHTDNIPTEYYLSISIKNNGIGPAIIKKIIIKFQETETDFNRENFLSLINKVKFPPIIPTLSKVSTITSGYCLGTGDEINLFNIKFVSPQRITYKELKVASEKFNIIITYNSVYGKESVVPLHPK